MQQRKSPYRRIAMLAAAATLVAGPAAAKSKFGSPQLNAAKVGDTPSLAVRGVVGLAPKKVERLKRATNPRADGFRLLRAGDREGALEAFNQAIQLQPRDAHLWRVIGDLQFRMERPERALEAWEHAVALRPSDTALLDRIARVATDLGELERAVIAQGQLVDELRDRADAAPDSHRLDMGSGQREPLSQNYMRHLVIYSELAVMAGDYTTGEEAARELIRFAPRHVSGHLALAYMHLQAAEFDDAELIYEEVLNVEPANPIALNNLGNIYYMRKDLDGAAERFERILEIEGVRAYSESIALANLAELLQLQGAYTDAISMYDAAVKAQPTGAWSYMGRAAVYDLIGDYDAAIDAMIDGWERDTSGITRLNMHFYNAEWFWQRDALIAEIEGEVELARELWMRVLDGNVEALHKAAAHHLRALEGDL